MSGATDVEETAIINYYFNGGAMATRSACWMALFSTLPTDSSFADELALANGYGRINIFSAMSVQDATAVRFDNDSNLIWTASGGDWLNILGCAFFPLVTGGTPFWTGGITAGVQIDDGEQFVVTAGQLGITVSG